MTERPILERERILKTARDLFLELGYRRVTMDDLAGELGMSKRTLYQHFPGKHELFRQTLLAQVQLTRTGLQEIVDDTRWTFPEKLRKLLVFMSDNLPRPGRTFLRDLQVDVRDVWEEVDRERLEALSTQFRKLMEQGVRDGCVRDGVDVHLFILMLVNLIQRMIHPSILSSLPLTAAQMFEEIVRILSLGILSDGSRRDFHGMSSSAGRTP